MNRSEANQAPWWKKQLIWGVVTTLLLAVLSVLVDQGGAGLRLGAVIAITGITLTLAVDFYLRITEFAADQQDLTAALIALGPMVETSDACRGFIADVAKQWGRIESQNSLLLRRILEDQQLEFRSRLRDLSNGRFAMDRQTFLQFRSLSMRDLRSMHGISATNPGYWMTPQGVHYLARQREAIAAGLTVKRILVLPQGQIADFAGVVRQQVDAGVHLTIVIRDQVEPDDLRALTMDRFVITDTGGVRGALFHDPEAEAHRITSEESEIRETERFLESLGAYEHQPEGYLPRSTT